MTWLHTRTSLQDYLTDALLVPIPFVSPGVHPPPGTLVHTGFLAAYVPSCYIDFSYLPDSQFSRWNSVVDEVLTSVRAELDAHPNYKLVASGHSLGGALASLAAITLKQNFPSAPLKLYSYGQPRVGNINYADFVNDQVGVDNIFRSMFFISL